MTSFHVGIAAEAFAAGYFAQAGCDVLVQYGANQPEYDLTVTRQGRVLRVSVKGSQDGGWGLNQSFKKGRSYIEAANAWEAGQKPDLVYCFVQFRGVSLGEAPRAYLATVGEVADVLRCARGGHGNTILAENHTYTKGVAKGLCDSIPNAWQLSEQRIAELVGSSRHQIS